MFKRQLTYLSSLKLTVALFTSSLLLLFFGTLAQVNHDISYVLEHYFRSFFCFVKFTDLLPKATTVPGGFPFLGGLSIGVLLLINLLAMIPQHFKLRVSKKRLLLGLSVFVLSIVALITFSYLESSNDIDTTLESPVWRVLQRLINAGFVSILFLWGAKILYKKRGSIFIVHLSIVFLLLFELFTHLFASESRMTIFNKEKISFLDTHNKYELVLVDETPQDYNNVIKIPIELLEGIVQHKDLPIDIEVVEYIKNSVFINEHATPLVTKGAGLNFHIGKTNNASGVSLENSENVPSYKLRFIDKKTKKDLGVYLVSAWFYPNLNQRTLEPKQYIETVKGKFRLILRNKRLYLKDKLNNPYSFYLEKFRHEKYLGTNVPRDFSSLVWIQNKNLKIHERVNIWMNNPLRYEGKTFYQSGYLADDQGTILQVVKNPVWFIPYFCFMTIMISLLVHFFSHLLKYLKKGKTNE